MALCLCRQVVLGSCIGRERRGTAAPSVLHPAPSPPCPLAATVALRVVLAASVDVAAERAVWVEAAVAAMAEEEGTAGAADSERLVQ